MATLSELLRDIGGSVNTMKDDLRNAELENKMVDITNLGAAAGFPIDPSNGVLNKLSGNNADLVNQYVTQALPMPEEADPYMAAFEFFRKMSEVSSQPGQTLLGATTLSVGAPIDYLNAKKAEIDKVEQARAALGLQIAPSLKPKAVAAKTTYRPATDAELTQYGATAGQMDSGGRFYDLSAKTGTGSTTKPFDVQIKEGGRNAFALAFPAATLPEDGIIPLRSDQLSTLPVGGYEIVQDDKTVTRRTFIDTSITDDDPDDNVNPQLVRITDEEAIAGNLLTPGRYAVPPSGSATNVNVDLGPQATEFAKKMGSATAVEFLGYMDSSNKASGTLNSYKQILAMLNRPDFNTGMFATAMRPLRQISREFNLDIFDTSEVQTAEVFTAKANELILASVAQMKGALSDKELNFLAEQNVNLANSTAGNKLLLLLQMQQIEKTVEFSKFANDWINANVAEDEDMSSRREYSKLMSSWRSSSIMQENPYQYVIRLADKRERELVMAAGGMDNLTTEDATRITQQLEDEFQLSYVEQTFNNYLWD